MNISDPKTIQFIKRWKCNILLSKTIFIPKQKIQFDQHHGELLSDLKDLPKVNTLVSL